MRGKRKSGEVESSAPPSPPSEASILNFNTTHIGDTVRIEGKEMLVVGKYTHERRLLLTQPDRGSLYPRSVSEFAYNGARPVLVRGKGHP